MRLRNKKTGEIKDTAELMYPDGIGEFFSDFDSLAELNEEWEDMTEEPKDYWYIDEQGDVYTDTDDNVNVDKERKEIGNYFETKEQAEKAVEKLKAWRRLKDNHNLGFNGIIRDKRNGKVLGARLTYPVKQITIQESSQVEQDLYLLFGGEE